jgi:hypothetical protein
VPAIRRTGAGSLISGPLALFASAYPVLVKPNRAFVPYVLLGVLTIGAGLGAGLGLATGPITNVPTRVVTLNIECSESFVDSSFSISSGSRAQHGSTSTGSSTSKSHCVVSGTGSKTLDRCLSRVASAQGTMTPSLPLPSTQVAACVHQFSHSSGGTITIAQPPIRTIPKGFAACEEKGMMRVKPTSGAALKRAFYTVVSTCKRQTGYPNP